MVLFTSGQISYCSGLCWTDEQWVSSLMGRQIIALASNVHISHLYGFAWAEGPFFCSAP